MACFMICNSTNRTFHISVLIGRANLIFNVLHSYTKVAGFVKKQEESPKLHYMMCQTFVSTDWFLLILCPIGTLWRRRGVSAVAVASVASVLAVALWLIGLSTEGQWEMKRGLIARPLDTPWFTVCQILITLRLRERKAERECEGSTKRNKSMHEYLEREGREKRRRSDVTSVESVCVCVCVNGIVATGLFHHTDKSRCESHCSELHVVRRTNLLTTWSSSFVSPSRLSIALSHLFSLSVSLSVCVCVCVCVRERVCMCVPVLVFINNYLWEMK